METRTHVLAAACTGSRSEQKDDKSSLGSSRLPLRLRRGRSLVRWASVSRLALAMSALLIIGLFATPPRAYAAEATVGLGTVAAFSVLGGQTVTNIGPTRLSGDLGVSPGTAITGFPPGKATGATHKADAVASKAQSDLVIGYNDAAGRAKTSSVAGDLVGKTLTAGVYNSTGPIALERHPDIERPGKPERRLHLPGRLNVDNSHSEQGECHQRRTGLQRLLAGRQLGDLGYGFQLHRNDHGIDVDHRYHRRHGRWSRTGSERFGHPGRRHVHLRCLQDHDHTAPDRHHH